MISVLTFGNQAEAPCGFTDSSAVRDWLGAGDEAAATWLYEKYFPLVRHVCSRRLPRAWMADDATQETMTRAFRALRHFDAERSFSAWITSIASRVCVDALRTFGRRLEIPVEDMDESGRLLFKRKALETADRERVQAMRELVGSLPPEVRTVVELYYFDGLTASEVASRAGLSPGNVAIRLMRARQCLASRAVAFGVC